MRYYYEPHDAECHSFNYTGCGGNGNNFRDYDSCMNTCRLPGECGAGEGGRREGRKE